MRLRPTDPLHRLSRDLERFLERRLGLAGLIDHKPRVMGGPLVVVADGSPDNRVAALIAHLLDGARTLDIAFPSRKHTSALDLIGVYARQGYRAIAVIIDQESYDLQELVDRIQARIPGRVEDVQASHGHRLLVSRVDLSSHTGEPSRVMVAVAINGVDDPRFTRHTIEDHLLILGERLRIISLEEEKLDPKEYYWKKLQKRTQEEILAAMASPGNRGLVNEVFKQQAAALKTL